MPYNFDTLTPPSPDGIVRHAVAEMYFPLAPEIKEGLQKCLDYGSFGYLGAGESYLDAVRGWMSRRHGWEIENEYITLSYGVVSALGNAVRAFSAEGDGVIIQPPVYHPFKNTVLSNKRRLISNPLKLENGRWSMDFDDLAEKAKDARLLMLCSPHNPVGRVWTPEELNTLGGICIDNGVIIISDEIHFDLVLPPNKHSVLATLSPELSDNCVICTAASKSFGIAGLSTSNIIISNSTLRAKYRETALLASGHFINSFGLAATEAALTFGDRWLDELIEYLARTNRLLDEYVSKSMPGVIAYPLEGTYLKWLDFSAYGLSDEALNGFLKDTKLYLSPGSMFGQGGEQHQRFNIACPQDYVLASLDRLSNAAARL